ncbi:MAG: T9SS type A sorting domain-containing protein, partial [Taibaiella sp.]|nr:T9SS type A sorting domain-containing protein [Taibaiella sp.]
GILHIEGVEPGSTIELIDVLGRKCAMASPYPPKWETRLVNVSTLVPGVYIVKVNGVVAGRVVKE